ELSRAGRVRHRHDDDQLAVGRNLHFCVLVEPHSLEDRFVENEGDAVAGAGELLVHGSYSLKQPYVRNKPAARTVPLLSMISFSDVSKQYGRQVIFVDASFQLNPGEKAGLVGPNGAGKTTLFRMIKGEESADDGVITVPKKISIGYFRQEVDEMRGRPVLDE